MLNEIIRLCRKYDIKLNPKLSQNFLHARHIIELEVKFAELSENDIVLDVGAGFGFLTEALASRAKKVYAIELDPRIAKVLRGRLRELIDSGRVEVIIGDALEVSLPKEVTKVVSNPPFHIISPLLFRLVENYFTLPHFKLCVLIVQYDFAKKLVAEPSEKRSRISATIQYFANVELIMKISRKNFFPVPEVDCALVRLRPRSDRHIVPFSIYNRVVTLLFNTPNRTLRRALLTQLPRVCVEKVLQVLDEYGVKPNLRVRELTNYQLELVAKIVNEYCLAN